MTWRDTVAAVLLWGGVGTVTLGGFGLLAIRDFYSRLHLLSGVSAIGIPLVVLGIAVDGNGWRSAIKLLVIGALSVGTGPVVTATTAQARSRREERAG